MFFVGQPWWPTILHLLVAPQNFFHFYGPVVCTVNILIASAYRFLWYIETELSFLNRSSKDERLYHYKLIKDMFHVICLF